MKFHGISMVGPFVNQRMADLPVWDATRDQGRLVWLTDGTLWYGSDIEWTSFSAGAGDASEVEDMYSDLLRTTIFMNASYDGFADEGLVSTTNMTFDGKSKEYTYSSGQYIESVNLYDGTVGLEFVDYFMVYVDYVEPGTGVQVIQVSTNGGVSWTTVDMLKTIKIPNDQAGLDIRLRFVGGGNGTLHSWGILYNKDLSAACTRWGLTYSNFEAFEGQTYFELTYVPGAIQVFLNGRLLDVSDYTAEDGQGVLLDYGLKEFDIVYIVSYSTSILDPSFDIFSLVHADGSIAFTGDQSMGGFNLIDLADGVNPQDAVTKNQLDSVSGLVDFDPYIRKDGTVAFTGNQYMGSNKLLQLADGTLAGDAVNFGQLTITNNNVTTNTGNIATNTGNIATNTSNIATLQSAVPVYSEIIGGDLDVSSTVVSVPYIKCFDSTKTVEMEGTSISNNTFSLSANSIGYIYVARLLVGTIVLKVYNNLTDVTTDASINAYRLIDYVNTNGIAEAVISKTINGIKYYQSADDVKITTGMVVTTGVHASINLTTTLPNILVSHWLPGATWSGGTTDTLANSSQMEISVMGNNTHCILPNFGMSVSNLFWGDGTAGINTELPPTEVYARAYDGGTSANVWSISVQKVYLKR